MQLAIINTDHLALQRYVRRIQELMSWITLQGPKGKSRHLPQRPDPLKGYNTIANI